MKSADILTSIL